MLQHSWNREPVERPQCKRRRKRQVMWNTWKRDAGHCSSCRLERKRKLEGEGMNFRSYGFLEETYLRTMNRRTNDEGDYESELV